MGLGLFGGGEGVARFLADRGAEVVVTDLRGEEELRESLAALAHTRLRFRLGRHEEEDFRNAGLVVANPSVPPDSPFLELARRKGVPIETEVSLFLKFCPRRVIGITGSNGKSTTTFLTGEMLKRASIPAWVGGNIGGSLLDHLEEIGSQDWLVMELSSFQLEYLGRMKWKPRIALLTNFTPNHLDRHGNLKNYEEAKRNIIRFQGEEDDFLYLWEDPTGKAWAREAPGKSLPFSAEEVLEEGAFPREGSLWIRLKGREERICPVSRVKLPGRFNLCNVLASALAARLAGAPSKAIGEAVEDFAGLEHRLEFVQSFNGVQYYNDSVSTTPESTTMALEAFPGPTVLIAGGYDKGIPFDRMVEVIGKRAKGVILIGQVAALLERKLSGEGVLKVWRTQTLEEAVARAFQVASPGDTVVLSPGCASFGMFRNYVERGRIFKDLVRGLARLKPAKIPPSRPASPEPQIRPTF